MLLHVVQQRNQAATPLPLPQHSPIALRSDIRSALPISDRFTQQFHRPYGNVWCESVLLDVTPQWLESLNHRQTAAARSRGNRVQATAASMAIVLVTIL